MEARTRSRLARTLAAGGVLLLAAGAWLSLPRIRAAGGGAPLDVLLVDVSRSVVARAEGAFAGTRGIRDAAAAHARARSDDAHLVMILPGDHVIVFCTRKKLVKKVEKLFQVGFHFF